jgi:hypothetical protein
MDFFVAEKDFKWAVQTASKKKKLDCSSAEFLTIDEGLCVQIMHLGAFDDEPKTVALMDTYLQENGFVNDFSEKRLHHEIYMSDARKVAPEKWKKTNCYDETLFVKFLRNKFGEKSVEFVKIVGMVYDKVNPRTGKIEDDIEEEYRETRHYNF